MALAKQADLGDGRTIMGTATFALKPAARWTAVLTSTLLVGFAYADGKKTPVQLPDGGQVVSKVEKQVRSKICRATREWVEIEGIPQPKAASLINARIRKEITVGRKLRDSDCPSPQDAEAYEYSNTVELSGAWHRYVGMQTTVCFPGGSGRCVLSCEVFDLQNGHRDDLKKYLDPSTSLALDALLTKQAEADDFPTGYLPLKTKEAAICLVNDGIHIVFMNDSGGAITSLAVVPAQIPRYFRLPPDLAGDVPSK